LGVSKSVLPYNGPQVAYLSTCPGGVEEEDNIINIISYKRTRRKWICRMPGEFKRLLRAPGTSLNLLYDRQNSPFSFIITGIPGTNIKIAGTSIVLLSP
jgi:hypothetical protein